MDTKKLNRNSIFLESFFNDVDKGLIYSNENTLYITKGCNVYSELINNIHELGCNLDSMLGQSIQELCFKIIIKYYTKLFDDVTINKVIYEHYIIT